MPKCTRCESEAPNEVVVSYPGFPNNTLAFSLCNSCHMALGLLLKAFTEVREGNLHVNRSAFDTRNDYLLPTTLATWINTPVNRMKYMEEFLQNKYEGYFEIRLGTSCNNDCTHCFLADRKNVSSEEVLSLLDNIPEGTTTIGVTGGEPTIHPYFLPLLKEITRRGYRIFIQTNGRKFSDMSFIEELKELPISGVLFAIHSKNYEVFDKITRVEGSGLEAWQGLKNITDHLDCAIITQTVITRNTMKSLVYTANAIQTISPGSRMTFTFVAPQGEANNLVIAPKYMEARSYIHLLINKWHPLLQTHYVPNCILHPLENLAINMDDFDFNMYRPGIDVIEGKWEKIDYQDVMLGLRKKSAGCMNCVYDDLCPGYNKAYANLYDVDDIQPIQSHAATICIDDIISTGLSSNIVGNKRLIRLISNSSLTEPLMYEYTHTALSYVKEISPHSIVTLQSNGPLVFENLDKIKHMVDIIEIPYMGKVSIQSAKLLSENFNIVMQLQEVDHELIELIQTQLDGCRVVIPNCEPVKTKYPTLVSFQ